MKISVIYSIINLIDAKVYIGSAINFNQRKTQHYYYLRANRHQNILLQRAFNKYEEKSFEFRILETVEDKTKLVEREQYWIDLLKSYDTNFGYNLAPKAGSSLGRKMSDEARAKMKGRKASKELKLQMSISRKGKKLSEEHKRKISEGGKGRIHSEETRLKISKGNIGKILSTEHKLLLSKYNTGRKRGRYKPKQIILKEAPMIIEMD